MNYPSLSLSKESIESAFKVATENYEKKTFKKHSGWKTFKEKFSSGDAQKCENCDFKTSKHEQMRQHIVIKHSGVKNKCTYCDYTHYFPNRVKIHENHVHKKIPRRTGSYSKKKIVCRNSQCPQVGTKECDFLESHCRQFCMKCKFSTKRTADLNSHIQSVHDGKVYTCEECQYSNSSRRRITLHIRSVHEGVVFSCDQCQYSAPEKRNLTDHIRTVHDMADFTCKICKVLMKTGKSLKRHELQTHEPRMFSCDQCKFSTKRKTDLSYHIQGVHEGMIFSCKQCQFTTKTKRLLNQHTHRIHEARITLKCEHCNYSPKTKRDLVFQAKVHTEVKTGD